MYCSTAGPNWVRQLATTGQLNKSKLINVSLSGLCCPSDLLNILRSWPSAAPPLIKTSSTRHHSIFVGKRRPLWTMSSLVRPKCHGMPETLFSQSHLEVRRLEWQPSKSDFPPTANDVNNSFRNTVGNGTDLYKKVIQSYFDTANNLYAAGARNFLFNNVVPFDRAQAGITLGTTLQEKLRVLPAPFYFSRASRSFSFRPASMNSINSCRYRAFTGALTKATSLATSMEHVSTSHRSRSLWVLNLRARRFVH